jgi:hypothetical protein
VKALSLWQPWATLVMLGAKRIETRSWGTEHRGPLLIHAGLRSTRELIELCHEEPFRTALRAAGIGRWQDLPRGAVLGHVNVVAVERIAGPFVPTAAGLSETHEVDTSSDGMMPPPEPEYSFGNYAPGRFAWLLEEPQAFAKPVPLRARQKLFDVSPEEIGLR